MKKILAVIMLVVALAALAMPAGAEGVGGRWTVSNGR